MPINLFGEPICLVCKDDSIIIEKNKLRIFNYFNIIFRDEPDIKEIKLQEETTKNVLPVLEFIVSKENEVTDLKTVSYYFFKWDGIVGSNERLSSLITNSCDDIYLDCKDAFEYFSKWIIDGIHVNDMYIPCESLKDRRPQVKLLIEHVCSSNGKNYYLKEEYNPLLIHFFPETIFTE